MEFNYIYGLIRLHFSETVKVLPNPGSVNLTKFQMFDNNQQNGFGLTESYTDPYTGVIKETTIEPVDAVIVNISVTPPMRWAALLISDIAYENEQKWYSPSAGQGNASAK